MNLNYILQIFIVGMAIFSMFFGGGNLTYPLWIGSETSSVTLSSFGFVLSGVLMQPLYFILYYFSSQQSPMPKNQKA